MVDEYVGRTGLVDQMVGAGDRNVTIPGAGIYNPDGQRLWEADIEFVRCFGFRMRVNGYDTSVREIDRPEDEECPYAFEIICKEKGLPLDKTVRELSPVGAGYKPYMDLRR